MTIEEVTSKLDQLEGLLTSASKRLESIEQFTPEEFGKFQELSPEDQGKFLESEEARKGFMDADISDDDATDDVGKGMTEDVHKKFDEIQKKLEKAEARADAAEKAAAIEKDARRLEEFAKRAGVEYPCLMGKLEEKGKILKAIHDGLSAEDAAAVEALLKSGNEALQQLGCSVGKGVEADATTDAWTRIEKAAAQLVAKDSKLSNAAAITKVLEDNPSLYDEYLASKAK